MQKNKLFLAAFILASTLCNNPSVAGNKDRSGQAGAYELLINPYARSSGWGGLNIANVKGIEATRLNTAGLAHTKSTELVFSKNIYLQLNGGDIGLNTLGFAQPLGKKGGVLGISIMSMTFGDIPITTTAVPDVINGAATLGTYKPSFLNVNLSYSKSFSESIHTGLGLTVLSESVPNAKAQGFALDAGIQYLTGAKKNVHFGIALRNIGTPMTFRGDGLSYERESGIAGLQQTVDMRSAKFDLPSQLSIGGAYDYKFSNDDQRISFAGKFTSNSFSKDQFGLGIEYGYKSFLMLRAGYNYEKGLFSSTQKSNVYTGLSAGLTFEVPLKKDGPSIGVDYSYRTTNPFYGTHAIGLRFVL
jgi:hypothetical protein